MISVNNIQVIFGKGTPLQKQALNGVSLTIEQGSFVTVIGSNGAGKSTLLGVLAGDVLPSAGQVMIGKTDVSRKGTAARAGLVARVFQDPLTGSCGALSIEENLALAAKRGEARGLTAALGPKRREHFRERIAELNLGLENRMGDRMDLLSGGQRQAVSLVMATLAGSEVLLLDEHTAALDPGMAEFVMNLTQKIVSERKLTTMMVTIRCARRSTTATAPSCSTAARSCSMLPATAARNCRSRTSSPCSAASAARRSTTTRC